MSIHVHNKTKNRISVAINHWGSDGKTGFFDIASGNGDSWSSKVVAKEFFV